MESEKNRFTIIPKGKDAVAIDLELDPFMQHGHVIELTGKTEAGRAGDGERAGSAGGGRRWQFPLLHAAACRTGESMITITAQNAKGGVNTEQKKVVIQ